MTRLLTKIILGFFALGFLSFAIIVVMISWEVSRWHSNYILRVRDIIPAKIEIEKIMADDYEEALPGGWCHGLTFKIGEKSLKEIQNQGLAFFKDMKPENPIQTENGSRHWIDWKEKPNSLPDDDTHTPNGCLSEFEKFKKKNGYSIKRDTKIYYTYMKHRGYSTIAVYPEWGIVAYSSWAN